MRTRPPAQRPAAATGEPAVRLPMRSYYPVALLSLTYMMSSIDRTLVSTIAEPLKRHFLLSDGELGLLTGLFFAASFALCGLPVGMLIDRWRRTALLGGLVAIWSGLTLASGLARSFVMLALARIGVGAAESGMTPCAMSILVDTFPPARRGMAMALFYLSTPIGVSLGFAVGGWVAAEWGWRAAFLVAGPPGLVLAAMVAFTIAEPQRGRFDGPVREAARDVSLARAWGLLWRSRPLRLLLAGGICTVLAQSALSAFLSPFLIRTHHVSVAVAGTALGAAHALGGIAGTLAGGVLADRSARRGPGVGPVRVGWLLMLAAPVASLALAMPIWQLAVVVIAIQFFLNGCYYGTHFSAYLGLAPAAMRGTLSATMVIAMTLVGYGGGPVLAGMLSDGFAAMGLTQPLTWALIVSSLGFAVAGALYVAAGRAIAMAETIHIGDNPLAAAGGGGASDAAL